MTTPATPNFPRERGALTGHIMTDEEKRRQDARAHWSYRFGVVNRHVSLSERMIADAEPVVPEYTPEAAVISAMRGLLWARRATNTSPR